MCGGGGGRVVARERCETVDWNMMGLRQVPRILKS